MLMVRVAGAAAVTDLPVGGALYRHHIHVARPKPPLLRGRIVSRAMDIGGRTRTMLVYVPPSLAPGAPLVLALHGSQSNPSGMRLATGYELERLADSCGFALVYPAGIGGAWNDCQRVAPFKAKRLDIDDVAFLKGVIEAMHASFGVARDQVFAVGYSNGAQMAFRMIFEAPGTLASAAVLAATCPKTRT